MFSQRTTGFILIIIFSSVLITGCTKIEPVDKKSGAKKQGAKTNQKPKKANPQTKSIKIYSLGKTQGSELWQYNVSKLKKTSAITNDLGVAKSAGKGKVFVLVYLTMKNLSATAESPLITYDPEPVIIAGKSQYEYEDGLVHQLPEKDQFYEGKELEKGKTQKGWLLFIVPAGKGGLKFKIEDLYWRL